MTAAQAKQIVKELQDWANASHAYLSYTQPYSKGYKDGIGQAKEIVRDTIERVLKAE